MVEPLVRVIRLACSREHAFHVFVTHIDLWWPRGHRRHSDSRLIMETRRGGRLLEHHAGGEWTMATVTEFEPARRLAFDWFPGSPLAPTHVEASFAEVEAGTEITLVHRPLSPGAVEIWPDRVARFAAGWDAVLPALKKWIDADSTLSREMQ